MGGFVRSFLWVNNYSKKQCRCLFGRMRTAVKKLAVKSSGDSKRQVKFQYDPSSYALNFDDGNFDMGVRDGAFRTFHQQAAELQSCSKTSTTTITSVYVLWVET
ncbi:hypothetical protein RND71_012151 [Anisodus tanguticus]|uniref:Uncharacterized protein n=1 Tax=Anisodus tanguticus TaxID=243964 RepID=A0AAE1SF64_9SOLA|nr:hypothetical protein RND71_012151 [Anisodus tanguticus]